MNFNDGVVVVCVKVQARFEGSLLVKREVSYNVMPPLVRDGYSRLFQENHEHGAFPERLSVAE